MRFVQQFETRSEAETENVGTELARLLPGDAVVALIGDLGAGKTTLVKGIVAGRQLDAGSVSSPTFALIHEYGEPAKVHHIDLYRLQTAAEADRLGLDEIYDRPGLTLIEWADRFPGLLPSKRFEVRLLAGEGDERMIELFDLD